MLTIRHNLLASIPKSLHRYVPGARLTAPALTPLLPVLRPASTSPLPSLRRALSPVSPLGGPPRAFSTAASSAVSTSSNGFIPIIDFSRYLKAETEHVKREVSDEITDAFKTAGFVYLKNHGISKTQLDRTFEMCLRFFQLPQETKDRLAWTSPRSNRGYVAQGRERVTNATSAEEIAALRSQAPDYKETMEHGRENDPTFPNQWPSEQELPGYRQTITEFRQVADKLHLEVLRTIALGLGLPETFFDKKCHEDWHNLRTLYYPSVEAEKLENGGSRAGEHSDYGSLTLLFQDNVGGLEVKNPSTGAYSAAPPIEGCVVINVGDLLSRWSNDTLRSTLHRVVSPPKLGNTGMTPARQSIAFFACPNEHLKIEVLPNCVKVGESAKYEPVVCGDYLEMRLQSTYS